MAIPNKQPIMIPIICVHNGVASVFVNFSNITPTNVPNVAPNKYDYVLPYPAQTLLSPPPGSKAKISSNYVDPKNKPALSMNPNIMFPPIPTKNVVAVTLPSFQKSFIVVVGSLNFCILYAAIKNATIAINDIINNM